MPGSPIRCRSTTPEGEVRDHKNYKACLRHHLLTRNDRQRDDDRRCLREGESLRIRGIRIEAI